MFTQKVSACVRVSVSVYHTVCNVCCCFLGFGEGGDMIWVRYNIQGMMLFVCLELFASVCFVLVNFLFCSC